MKFIKFYDFIQEQKEKILKSKKTLLNLKKITYILIVLYTLITVGSFFIQNYLLTGISLVTILFGFSLTFVLDQLCVDGDLPIDMFHNYLNTELDLKGSLEEITLNYLTNVADTAKDDIVEPSLVVNLEKDIEELNESMNSLIDDSMINREKFLSKLPGLVCLSDSDGEIIFANNSFQRYFKADEGSIVYDLFDSSYSKEYKRTLAKITSNEFTEFKKGVELLKNKYYTELSLPFYSLISNEVYCLTMFIDSTKDYLNQESLKLERNKLKTVFQELHDLYLELNTDLIITDLSPSVTKILGYSQEELIGKPLKFLLPDELDYKNVYDLLNDEEAIKNKKPINDLILHLMNNKGRVLYTSLSGHYVTIKGQTVFSGIVKDISERRQLEEEMRQLATYDSLTGAYNREFGLEILKNEMKRYGRTGSPVSLCFIDVNGLKEVNDNLGHKAGDDLLINAVEILRLAFRTDDTIIRYGGDEFVTILFGASEETSEQAWERVQDNINYYNTKVQSDYNMSLSHGVIEYKGDLDIVELVDAADEMMYEEKSKIKSKEDFTVLR